DEAHGGVANGTAWRGPVLFQPDRMAAHLWLRPEGRGVFLLVGVGLEDALVLEAQACARRFWQDLLAQRHGPRRALGAGHGVAIRRAEEDAQRCMVLQRQSFGMPVEGEHVPETGAALARRPLALGEQRPPSALLILALVHQHPQRT